MGNHFHITDNFAVRGCQPNESKLKPIEVLTSQVHTGNLVRFLSKICYNHDIMTVRQLDFLRKLGFLRILEDSCDSISPDFSSLNSRSSGCGALSCF